MNRCQDLNSGGLYGLHLTKSRVQPLTEELKDGEEKLSLEMECV